ncbi:MAG: hypothetical protein JSU63_11220 [Phycisphaerales bacterium]|nr:MAG: hypothetical protein JSU63_11220 [Phycisphaerales bacterium]
MSSPYRTSGSHLARLVLAAFVLISCLRVWLGPTQIVPSAEAQIPDSAMQRRLLVEEAKRTNQLLSEIKQILTSRTLNVRVAGADKPGADN